MSILFYDTEISGHHCEYINHLVEYIAEKKLDGDFIFVTHPQFKAKFPAIFKKADISTNIRITEISQKEHESINKGVIIRRSINAYRLMNRYARKYKAQKVFLLYFNTYQLALGLFRQQYSISGILFLQFYRMERNSLKDKLKYHRKYWQTWLYTRNKAIKNIYILNDPKSVKYLNSEFKTEIFQMIPDPVPVLIPNSIFLVRKTFHINPNRKIFLHFGSLSERKGTLDIMEAFHYIESKDISNMALLLIGKASRGIDEMIKKSINSIQQKHNNALIIYKNDFVDDPMMKSYFDQCDYVLIPYKNVESSSGIFGHAMAAKKPVIGTKKGLLGELIMENNLGIAIDDQTPAKIAEAIHQAMFSKKINVHNTNYLDNHSKICFAEKILFEYDGKNR